MPVVSSFFFESVFGTGYLREGMSIEQIINAVDIAIHRFPYMEACINRSKSR